MCSLLFPETFLLHRFPKGTGRWNCVSISGCWVPNHWKPQWHTPEHLVLVHILQVSWDLADLGWGQLGWAPGCSLGSSKLAGACFPHGNGRGPRGHTQSQRHIPNHCMCHICKYCPDEPKVKGQGSGLLPRS